MNIEIINDLERFKEIKSEWNTLLENSIDNQIFYRWEWQYTFANKFLKKEDELFLIIIWNNQKEILAIAPLKIISKKILLKNSYILTFLTDKLVDYNSFIITKEENTVRIIKKIFDEIKKNKKWNLLKLDNISDKFGIPNIINYVMNFNKFTISSYVNVISPYFIFQNNNVNKSQIKDIERREKRLNNNFNVEFSSSSDFNIEVFNKLIELHKKEYKKNSIFNDMDVIDFYTEISNIMEDSIELSYLKVDENIAAIHFGFVDKNKVYYYIPKFEDKYQKDAVGLILLKNTIDKYKDKLFEFDSLRGEEFYKFHWTDKISANFTIWAISHNKRNIIENIYLNLFSAFKTIPALSAFYNKIRREK